MLPNKRAGTEHSRHVKALQHTQGRLQQKIEDDGKDDGQHDLPPGIERGEERQHE
jgi:hypothetical protein